MAQIQQAAKGTDYHYSYQIDYISVLEHYGHKMALCTSSIITKKEREPIYQVISERSVARKKEFVMQCTINDKIATGMGPNKKTAKKNAAENMLRTMGHAPSVRPEVQPEVGNHSGIF